MYIRLDQELTLRESEILGFFDLDTCSWSARTRRFLKAAEQDGRLTGLGPDIPDSFAVTASGQVYLLKTGTKTLRNRFM